MKLRNEFEIIENLSNEYSIKSLCDVMNVSRSGYYKWLKTRNELNRKNLRELIIKIHNQKKSYGYRKINAVIRRETGWFVSDNLVHKVCKLLKIRSKAKHYSVYKSQEKNQINIQI